MFVIIDNGLKSLAIRDSNALVFHMHSREKELHKFKTQINLCEYAASFGYEIDRKASSRQSVVMRNSSFEKLVISRNGSGHWIYFNVHDSGNDKGSIIDFIQTRKGLSLGEVRRALRFWVGADMETSDASKTIRIADLKPTVNDAALVTSNWRAASEINSCKNYLTADRRLPYSTLKDRVFADRIRIDSRSNILFPHWNLNQSLCGYELKNHKFTGFSPGGTKGLWCSRPRATDEVVVLTETAIDSLSLAAILGTEKKRFFSTAGQISPTQAACLRSAVSRMPNNAEIWLAFDNDDGGRKLAQQVSNELAVLPDNPRNVVMFLPPQVGEDWNDVLRNEDRSVLPSFQND